jgi:hypothetical protein
MQVKQRERVLEEGGCIESWERWWNLDVMDVGGHSTGIGQKVVIAALFLGLFFGLWWGFGRHSIDNE